MVLVVQVRVIRLSGGGRDMATSGGGGVAVDVGGVGTVGG